VKARDRELVRRFWSGTSLRALAPLLGAIFFTFAVMGFLVDITGLGRTRPGVLAAVVAFSGLVAVAYALIGIRRRYWLFAPVVVLQVLVPRWLERLWPGAGAASGEALHARLVVDAIGVLAALALGYGFFMMFIVRQGLRRVRADAEMDLAREIHASLVPVAALQSDGCEMYGRSIPASEVGGDLVDALLVDGRPLGVVADVSGHGVPAGMLMGLLKASLRMRLRSGGGLADVFSDLNDVLADLTQPNTFATAAILRLAAPTRLEFALAGHPPILHLQYASRAQARLGDGGMALGIRRGERYRVEHAEVGPGDVLAVLTDGFSETMDGADRELGLAAIERVLLAHADEPLPALFERLVERASAHGPQQDDRTLLLVRMR
jgi:sigma-B regulation protein RsbU (phosphoserine phosphatase)